MHRWGNKKDMAGDDPPYLTVGTEVSAKYKGAFCEAKIRKVVKTVKCKVQYKNEQGSAFVNDDQIKGLLMSGASVEVKQPEKKDLVEGTIVKIQDLSQYTVVFDDGDIATLRRTALCLKSGRHFAESETLDQLPLTHPEHFSTPVVSGVRGSRRRDEMDDNSDDEDKQEIKVEREEDMGKVVCVEVGDKKKSKDNWFPGLIVAPNAQDSVKIDIEDEYLVRSFKDGRYYTVPKSETVEFTREVGFKVENPTLKQAVEKAILFLDKSDLPPHWDREQLFGLVDFPSDTDASDTDSMDDEPREEKDHFVAQLYKFMDDRGTPINKGPMISSRDVDLYKLFKIVYKLGGYNRVTNRNQWKSVAMKLGYNASQTNNVKSSYKKYLHSFEDFYRKLGCTLLTTSRDNKLRSRSNRSLIRDRNKSLPDKLLDKDENSSSNNEDVSDLKEANNVKVKSIDAIDNDEYTENKEVELEEDYMKPKNKDHSAENMKDDKFKKKIDSNIIKDIPVVQLINFKENKDEKLPLEKKTERKSLKLVSRSEEPFVKKLKKCSIRTKIKKTKPVERRIKKNERTLSQIKERRSLKDRMKAIVEKLKIKNGNSNDHEKKKQKAADIEINKLLQHGIKVRLKDEFASIKTKQLATGNNDSKNSTSGGAGIEKKNTGSSSSASSVSDCGPGPSNSITKMKKSDEETNENCRKKTASRKKKDDDKFSNNSVDSLMNQAIEFVPHYKTICIGDKLKVYYEPTHESKVTYEAKVTNKRYGPVTEYLVHYTGWNTRYDEWIRRSRIADNLSWTPLRAKKKSPTRNVPTAAHLEQSSQPNQNSKILADKQKQSAVSPVVKNRTKNAMKSGIKQMKNVKKLESKSKKLSTQKDSDSGSESDSECNQKKTLQKTRSRTEKQKQQDDESSSSKDQIVKESKKAPPPLKRTRSGSIKLENQEVTKKHKVSPSARANGKTAKTSSICSSIIKSLVPPKRNQNRTKEFKEEKSTSISPIENKVPENKVETNNVRVLLETKAVTVVESKKNIKRKEPSMDITEKDEKHLVLKITPISPEKIAELELTPEEAKSDLEANENESVISSSDDTGPPVLKKEVLVEECIPVIRTTPTQFLPDSYLSENLEIKPKIGAKLKKDIDEKSVPPSKGICRSPSEKLIVKQLVGDVKEKTFFTSRSPSDKKNERTPEKDNKLRNVNTYTSYLNMDKIECIKKVVEKGEKEKLRCLKSIDSLGTGEDDIYEFKEPEPFEFRAIDDRTILHRRSTPRIFEDSSPKRTKMVTSTDAVMKEVDDPNKFPDEMNIIESKSVLEESFKSDVDAQPIVDANIPATREIKIDDTERPCIDTNECEELSKNALNEPTVTDILPVEEVVSELDPAIEIREEPCLIATLASTEELEDSECEESAEDDDVEESKSSVLENDVASGLTAEEPSDRSVEEVKPDVSDVEDTDTNTDIPISRSVKSTSVSEENSRSSSTDGKLGDSYSSSDGEEDTEETEARSGSADESGTITKESSPVFANKDLWTLKSSNVFTSEKENICSNANLGDKVKGKISEKLNAETYQLTNNCVQKDVVVTTNLSKVEEYRQVNVDASNVDQVGRVNSSEENIVITDDIVAEIEIEVSSASKKETDEDMTVDKNVEIQNEKLDTENFKSKDEEDAVNGGLLLCEETIPKSPESKDTNDVDVVFSNSSRIPVSEESKKLPNKKLNKLKNEPKSGLASPNSNTFENTPPSTPEGCNSTPGTSPSEEISGFSSATFSLHEKSGSNKDSSENETSSDASEKFEKVKKFSSEAYAKKNAFEFGSYLKRKAEQEVVTKEEEPAKKKNKNGTSPSTNERDKDDADSENLQKTVSSTQKSSVANILKEIPPSYDANQRIEFMEQKLQEIRKAYNSLKQEVASIDKKRKKLRRRQREGRMMTRNEANSLL